MNLIDIASEISSDIIKSNLPVSDPTVIILVGLQYSGKSTIARLIANNNYTHFWATKVKEKYSIDNKDMLQVVGFVIEKVASQGFNLIVDYVNHKKVMRDSARRIALDTHAKFVVLYLNTPKDERLRRREVNVQYGDIPGRRVISIEQIEKFEKELEIPDYSESPIMLSSQNDIDTFIASLNPGAIVSKSMRKLDQFTYNDNDLSVKYIETQTVKDGVECDIYEFSGDDSRDLAIVRVLKGFSTPRQLVVKGDQTFEGFISGKAVLSVHDFNGLHAYTFPNNEYSEVVVLINQTMQWTALEDLVFYEICRPPYEEGRFKNLF